MAIHNARFLVQFMAKLSAELRGDPLSVDEAVLRRFEPWPETARMIYGNLCKIVRAG
ncbi:putative hydrolase [Raoultella ornithinolytica]|nr:putative hydrolase [Raoultella ornithinolytica]